MNFLVCGEAVQRDQAEVGVEEALHGRPKPVWTPSNFS